MVDNEVRQITYSNFLSGGLTTISRRFTADDWDNFVRELLTTFDNQTHKKEEHVDWQKNGF